MQLMVLYHHGFYYYNIKLEVSLVPGVCSGLSGKGEGNGFRRHAGQLGCSVSPPRSGAGSLITGRDPEALVV